MISLAAGAHEPGRPEPPKPPPCTGFRCCVPCHRSAFAARRTCRVTPPATAWHSK